MKETVESGPQHQFILRNDVRSTSQLDLDLVDNGHGDRKSQLYWCCCGTIDSPKKQIEERSFLERVRVTFSMLV